MKNQNRPTEEEITWKDCPLRAVIQGLVMGDLPKSEKENMHPDNCPYCWDEIEDKEDGESEREQCHWEKVDYDHWDMDCDGYLSQFNIYGIMAELQAREDFDQYCPFCGNEMIVEIKNENT